MNLPNASVEDGSVVLGIELVELGHEVLVHAMDLLRLTDHTPQDGLVLRIYFWLGRLAVWGCM